MTDFSIPIFSVPIFPPVKSLQVYQPGKPIEETERELGIKDVIKLASNENPLGPSPKAMAAIQRVLPQLHLYPDGSGFHLKRRLAKHLTDSGLGIVGLSVPENEIILGNGSNEILEFIYRAVATSDGNVIIGWPSFVIYQLAAQAAGLATKRVAMPNFQYDVRALHAAIDDKTRVILIGHPSNPTGTYVPKKDLEWLIANTPDNVVIVIDEAYFEYVDAKDYVSGLHLRKPNVVVLRTFSKAYGLAGLRIGYGVTSAEFVSYLNRIREPFNVGSLALAGAQAALDDQEHVQRCVRENAAERARISGAFEKHGCSVVPSQTNFILVDLHRPAAAVFEALLKRGVITRPMKQYEQPTALRLSFGTRAENDRLIQALGEVLSG